MLNGRDTVHVVLVGVAERVQVGLDESTWRVEVIATLEVVRAAQTSGVSDESLIELDIDTRAVEPDGEVLAVDGIKEIGQLSDVHVVGGVGQTVDQERVDVDGLLLDHDHTLHHAHGQLDWALAQIRVRVSVEDLEVGRNRLVDLLHQDVLAVGVKVEGLAVKCAEMAHAVGCAGARAFLVSAGPLAALAHALVALNGYGLAGAIVAASVRACAVLGLHARVVVTSVKEVSSWTHATWCALLLALNTAKVLVSVLTGLGARVGAFAVDSSVRACFGYLFLLSDTNKYQSILI